MFDRLKGWLGHPAPKTAAAPAPASPRSSPRSSPHSAPAPAAAPERGLNEALRYAPVLDRRRQVVVAHFSLRPALATWAVSQPEAYGELLLAGLAPLARLGVLRARPALLTLPERCLHLAEVTESLVQPRMLLELVPEGEFDDALRQRWRDLQEAGVRIAFDVSRVGETPPEAIAARIAAADVLRVDAARIPVAEPQGLRALIRRHRGHATWAVTGIDSEEDRQLCEQLGFAWFSGPYLTQRRVWSDRDVPAAALRVVDLLNRLRRDAEVGELAQAIKQDAALPYRLLRYLNSAALGMRQKITSIEHAVVIVGRDKLYRWLLLMMYATGGASANADALLELGLVRARFMELAGGAQVRPEQRDILFVTGLFSLLDLVLGVPLAKALAAITVHDAVPAALLRHEGPLAPWLDLALACENGEAEAIREAAQACGVAVEQAVQIHLEALAWAQALQAEVAENH